MKVFKSILILVFWMSFVTTEDFKNYNTNRTKREPPVHSAISFRGYTKAPFYGPPKSIYGPPKPVYGPPKSLYSPPGYKYGPPKPIYTPLSTSYSPVSPSYNYDVPKPVYNVPSYNHPVYSQGVPQMKYGPPFATYNPPSRSPNYTFYPSNKKPSIVFTPPSPNYRVPSPTYEAPSFNYGAPSLSYEPPASTYGQPSPTHASPSSSYGAPSSSSSYGAPPSSSYGPPPSSSYGAPPSSAYGAPPSSAYGAPPSSAYGAPLSSSYGTPSSSSYGVPPSSSYGVPPSSTYGVPPPSPKSAPPPATYKPPSVNYKAPASRYVPTYNTASATYEPSVNPNPQSNVYGIPQNHGAPTESYGSSSVNSRTPLQGSYVFLPYTHATPSSGYKSLHPYENADTSYGPGDYTFDRPVFNSIGAGYEIPVTHKPHPLQYNSQAISYETPGALTSYGTPAVNHGPPINYGISQKRANFVLGDGFTPYEDIDTLGLSSSLVTNANVDGFEIESKSYGYKQDSSAFLPERKIENRTLNHNFDGPGVTDEFLLETAFKSKQLNKRANAKVSGIINNFLETNSSSDLTFKGKTTTDSGTNIKKGCSLSCLNK